MASATAQDPHIRRVEVDLRLSEAFGWRRLAAGDAVLWFKGYLHGGDAAAVLAAFAGLADPAAVAAWLDGLDGHFALVATRPDLAVAAVDPVRSVPLFFAHRGDRVVVDSQGGRLADHLALSEVDPDGALALAMAGYTIAADTLYRGLHQLGPGQCLILGPDGAADRRRYHRYEPWRAAGSDGPDLADRLAAVTRGLLEKLIRSADGRPIAVPLSGGLDSRLVASGLVALGYRNIRCFAYGRPGHFEVRMSRRVAEHLGLPWRFHAYRPADQAAFFRGRLHRDFLDFADTAASCPFVQDLGAVAALKADGFIPDDAILVNGNSGDFISGLHVPRALHQPLAGRSEADRRGTIVDSQITKHFRLWQALATPDKDARIARRLARHLAEEGLAPGDPAHDFALAEFLEFDNRQCKYVITGQRTYEFLGHDWRLPLWDRDYLDFWQTAPLTAKIGQRLYRETLERLNWGGVWGPDWRVRRAVSPPWMRWVVRPLAKAAHAPLGRRRWHAFERRYLGWWMDPLAAVSVVPYARAAADRRGARHSVAWHTEAYLAARGLDFAGRPRDHG